MKKAILVGCAAAALSVIIAACATTPRLRVSARGDYDGAFEYLSGHIEEVMKKSKVVGLSVAVVSDREVLWAQGFGYADKENNIPVTPQTLFDPASVSKLFTATGVMQLVEQGKIDLDESYSTYIPEFSMKSRFSTTSDDITVRHLLTHQSGIIGDWFKDTFSLDPDAHAKYRDKFLDLPKELKDVYLCWPPEYTHSYSNIGFANLGVLIDRMSGKSFFDYTEIEVLGKIGMTESTFDLDLDLISASSKGYMNGKEGAFRQLYDRDIPAGSLTTSADELAMFMMSYLDEEDTRLIKPETKEEMFSIQNAHVKRDLDFTQGLGWMISDFGFTDAGRIVYHDGGEAYYNARLVLLVDQDIGVSILTNSVEGADVVDPISKEIIRTVLQTKTGAKPTEYGDDPPAVVDPSDALLAELEGNYVYPSLGMVQFEIKRFKLMAYSGGMSMEMVPYANGRYGVQPLLFGFIPIKVPFLKDMEFSFKEVEGDMLSGVYKGGAPMPGVGKRVERHELNDTWISRQGTYEAIDLGDDYAIISQWDIVEREGFLFIDCKLYGILPFSLVLAPVDDEYAFWEGLGRGSGETFAFEENERGTFITYAGYTYQKIK